MTRQHDPMELLEGDPFPGLVEKDEKARIDARIEELVAADAAIVSTTVIP